MTSKCAHLPDDFDIEKEVLLTRSEGQCTDCKKTGSLWGCLKQNCNFNGCGGKIEDHVTKHYQKTEHSVAINLSTFRVWCFSCDKEIQLFTSAEIKLLKKEKKERQSSRNNVDAKPNVKTQDSARMEADYESGTDASLRGLTGLHNMGNTCYMNSALQAISNCPPLTYYFLRGYDGSERIQKNVSMAESYYKLIHAMWSQRKRSCIAPNGVHMTLKTINPSFRGYHQQDAQEFLRCFMDRLHEELKEVIPKWTYADDASDNSEEASMNASDESNGTEINQTRHVAGPVESEPNGSSDEQTDEFSIISESQPLTQQTVPSVSAATPRKRQSSENELHGSERSPGQQQQQQQQSPVKVTNTQQYSNQTNKKPSYRFRSIISEIFDGELRSSVQCLTCDQVSHTRETFQDLSLPIPGKDDLVRLHNPGAYASGSGDLAVIPGFNGPCAENARMAESWFGYAWNMWEWMKSWFWGPQVTLNDCLSAFFSADELKGDNMYSCNRCNKLRNGVKYCKLLQVPEVLCIHLKRFRHEYQMSYSSKISSPVSFPITGLDLRKFLGQDSPSACTTYDLCSVIVHHGNAGGGHYTAYAKNMVDDKWYEFDDQYVTEVSETTVANAEAYVLFYQKSSVEAGRFRERMLQTHNSNDLLRFYISARWLSKFLTFSDPGPIDNSDFLCRHSGVLPEVYDDLEKYSIAHTISKSVWEQLHGRFGGGPAVTTLSPCTICQQELELMQKRRHEEGATFRKLNKLSNTETHQSSVYISLEWFHEWEDFLTGKLPEPPGQIDNGPICYQKEGKFILRRSSPHAPISRMAWDYLISVYDGGPEVPHLIRNTRTSPTPKSKRSATVSPAHSPTREGVSGEKRKGSDTTTRSPSKSKKSSKTDSQNSKPAAASDQEVIEGGETLDDQGQNSEAAATHSPNVEVDDAST